MTSTCKRGSSPSTALRGWWSRGPWRYWRAWCDDWRRNIFGGSPYPRRGRQPRATRGADLGCRPTSPYSCRSPSPTRASPHSRGTLSRHPEGRSTCSCHFLRHRRPRLHPPPPPTPWNLSFAGNLL